MGHPMVANINLHHIPNVGSGQAIFSWSHFNISRNSEWVSQATKAAAIALYVLAGVAYSCYHLYKAIQLKFRPARALEPVLDHEYKRVKFEALLKVDQKPRRRGEITLLEQCASLLDSLDKDPVSTDRLRVSLIERGVDRFSPEQLVRVAEKLSSSQ